MKRRYPERTGSDDDAALNSKERAMTVVKRRLGAEAEVDLARGDTRSDGGRAGARPTGSCKPWRGEPSGQQLRDRYRRQPQAGMTQRRRSTGPASPRFARPTRRAARRDEAFGQAQEDTAVPAVVTGGIPPNKSDLKFFGLYQEGSTSAGFLNLFWSKVRDPREPRTWTSSSTSGSAHRPNPGGSGLHRKRPHADPQRRRPADQYDLSNGGVNPTLSIRQMDRQRLGSGDRPDGCWRCAGSINTSRSRRARATGWARRTRGPSARPSWPVGNPRPDQCDSFGSAYLKSRSSDRSTRR